MQFTQKSVRYTVWLLILSLASVAPLGCASLTGDRADAEGRNEPAEPAIPPARAEAAPEQSQAQDDDPWTYLFDGETLENWEKTNFGGEGEIEVEEDRLILGFGNNLTGITWEGEPPARMNYEIELEAMRVEGNDFFCGLTFPVGDEPCSLIVGGWGGGLVGLSSIDGYDASENSTSSWQTLETGKWYHIRLRVTEPQIEVWLDDEKVVDLLTEDHEFSVRPEVELSRPLGIASYQTIAALRDIRLREVEGPADPIGGN